LISHTAQVDQLLHCGGSPQPPPSHSKGGPEQRPLPATHTHTQSHHVAISRGDFHPISLPRNSTAFKPTTIASLARQLRRTNQNSNKDKNNNNNNNDNNTTRI